MKEDYTTSRELYGRSQEVMNMPKFAADLACGLGGTVVKQDSDISLYSYAEIDVEEGVRIACWRTSSHGAKHLTVRAEPPPEIPFNDCPSHPLPHMPGAKVSWHRPMQDIIRDVKRRVVDPAKPAMEAWRKYHEHLKHQRAELAQVLVYLKQEHPHLHIALAGNGLEATFDHLGDGPYLRGTIDTDGDAHLERIGKLTRDQFDAVCKVLYGTGN